MVTHYCLLVRVQHLQLSQTLPLEEEVDWLTWRVKLASDLDEIGQSQDVQNDVNY